MSDDPFAPTCPFCGKHDVAGLSYENTLTAQAGTVNIGPTVLVIRHEDGRECRGTPPSERRPTKETLQ